MVKQTKLKVRILAGRSDANVDFADLRKLLVDLGFDERVRGSHHIFVRDGVTEIINLQPKSAKAKPYQVKQIRSILLKYHLGGSDVDEV